MIWFDVFAIDMRIKQLLGYKKWTSKVEAVKTWHRVFFCYFCTSFWMGVIASIITYLLTGDLLNCILLIISNTIISRLFDVLFGHKSV